MKRAIIVGISGQDGCYLAKLLLEKGYEVHGTSRAGHVSAAAGLARLGLVDRVIVHRLEPAEAAAVAGLVERLPADEIYNLAGPSSVADSFRKPAAAFTGIILGTLHVLEALRTLGRSTRLYSAGSSEIFGDTPTPADETTCPDPQSPYAIAKATALATVAHYRRAHGLFAATGILFNHESPLRPPHFVTQKVVSAAVRIAAGSRERLALGDLAICRDWGWAPDYVEAMWRILQHDRAEDFVVATGQSHSLDEFVRRAFAAVGLDARDHVDVDPALLRPADIRESRGDPAKARAALGWQAAHDLDAIIREMVAAARPV
jgi:GDPmannose 4,6-dehydratase